MNTWLKGVEMLQRTQDEQPEKYNDQVLADISYTIKSQPVGWDFTIKKGGVMNGNFILRVARYSSENNGNDRRAHSIILLCL